ncbi:MAG: hypothetical protein J6W73_04570 [Verrucomicrobia bacterium]|nr:hypothetical protein [Verrucomicrobiota bacterium]
MKKDIKKTRSKQFRQVNFLIPGVVTHRIQQFECVGAEFKAPRSQDCPIHKKPKEDWTSKDYRNLFRKKINVSWASIEDVFMKVIHLPGESPEELRMMVELQLEKISPVPLAQLVWDIQVLPNPVPLPVPDADPEHPEEVVRPLYRFAVVVLMAERAAIENLLALLEESNFQADRIELPFLHEILQSPETKDGLYVYPMRCGAKDMVVTVWWAQGQLQDIDVIYLPPDETWKGVFSAQLNQVIWAGQLAGWLNDNYKWTLLSPAEDDEALPINEWTELLTNLYGAGTFAKRMSESELAKLNCTLICTGPTANLLPPEFATTYKQKYTDKLWLQGIAAIVIAYILACMVYFAGSTVASFQKSRAEAKLKLLDNDYKTAQKLKAQVELLQLQETLKFAALDCYRLTAELLPEGLKLTRMNFTGGTEWSYVGEAPADQIGLVTAFNEALGRAMTYDDNPVPFFKKVAPPTSVQKAGAGDTLTWRFTCELNLPELKTK